MSIRKMIPKDLYSFFLKKKFSPSSFIDNKNIKIKMATTKEEFEAGLKLLHDCYISKKYMTPDPTGYFFNSFALLPETNLIIATFNDKVIGAVYLYKDSYLGLPSDKYYGKINDFYRKSDGKLAEISAVAVHDSFRNKDQSIFLLLMKYVLIFSKQFLQAYCLGITNIDPIKYDLLFERFLNPDRVSMPDIDIDFDDEGRGRVMGYVINKYGAYQVAQIITYGKMPTKSAIRDTARVLDLPLFEADRIAKLIPGMMPSKWNLARFISEKEEDVKKALRSDECDRVKELIAIANEGDLPGETIQQAKVLEGSLRNTGIHACGVIITPDDITNFVPVTTAKDSELYVTQFDNSVAESAGL